MEKTKAKPCPFCGSEKLKESNCFGDFWITCMDCNASCGMEHETMKEAWEGWNTRAKVEIRQFDCKCLHELFNDKDGICPYCSQPFSKDF